MKSDMHQPPSLQRRQRVRAQILRERSEAPRIESLEQLRAAVNACQRCTLWRGATQGVAGEGPDDARLMLVGEQPGDAEDLAGRPFVGPAGAMLDRALAEAGLDRNTIYLTNAVKHFKHEPGGKRRLHVKPNTVEIQACRGWLSQEIQLLCPQLIVALGTTAARSVLGRPVTITSMRGLTTPLPGGMSLMVTIHPSHLLRIPDAAVRRAEYQRFVKVLRGAKNWLNAKALWNQRPPLNDSNGPYKSGRRSRNTNQLSRS